MNHAPQRFVLTLLEQPDPEGVPVLVRLRRCLKEMGRRYKLRCVRAVETTPRIAPETRETR